MKLEKFKKYSITIITIISLFIIISLWILTYNIYKDDPERGTFGDMFGSVNALYSGLAFAGIIITILLQKRELKYQRIELQQTRNEFKIQNETLKLQRFENTFFNLLSLHHQIVDSIDMDIQKPKKQGTGLGPDYDKPREYDRIIIKGRDVFKEKYHGLKYNLSNSKNIDKINARYLEVYETVQTDFGHYFRNLYRIIKLIDRTEFYTLDKNDDNPENKKLLETKNFKIRYEYTSIVRSQLSDYELLWLFYNCLSDNGIEKFKKLVEKYLILKNIPIDKLNSTELVTQYESLMNVSKNT